jgi:hypothetical protein
MRHWVQGWKNLRGATSVIACCLLLGAAGCSNGRGSVSSDTPGGGSSPPPSEPANPPDTYTIGGEVSGVLGSGLVLQLNGANDTRVVRNGTFVFPSGLAAGASYAVSVATQPSNPAQTCTVSNGAGTVEAQNVTSVTVVCSTQSFSVGGSVAGLEGRGLVLQLNGAEDLPIASDGAFTFPSALASGSEYEITVRTQPEAPSQTCTVANASGIVGSGTVSSATVTCATNTFSIGGTVVGLEGDRLVLQNSNETVEVQADGTFSFPGRIASGGTYNVTVQTAPSDPAQACSIANGEGTVTAADVTDVTVTCTRRQFTVGGVVGGLAGSGLVLRNNGADDLAVTGDGPFTFPTAIESGRPYDVEVVTQPTSPAQECAVESASGTVDAENVTAVRVQCVTIEYTLGGSVSGLAGSGLVLQNNGQDNLAIAANGPFAFATSLPTGAAYDVTVATQPSNLTQVCTVANGAGTMGSEDIADVRVTCETSRFNVRVVVSGLRGFSLRLRNNGEDILVHSDGTYSFPTSILSGQPYNVAAVGGPIFPSQQCAAQDGTGTVTDRDVEVQVICN